MDKSEDQKLRETIEVLQKTVSNQDRIIESDREVIGICKAMIENYKQMIYNLELQLLLKSHNFILSQRTKS